MLRVYNIAGSETDIKVESFRGFSTAYKANIVEDPAEPLPIEGKGVRLGVGKYSIESLLLK